MHIISKNIKALRLERGWTQQEMADMLFVTRQTVSNWENGKALPDVETLLQIAEKLDIDVNELVYGRRKAEELLKKEILFSFFVLITAFVLNYLIRTMAMHSKWDNPFYTVMVFVPYLTLRPLMLFFFGRITIQLLKLTNIIKHTKGIKRPDIFRKTLICMLIWCFLSTFEGIRMSFILLMFKLKKGQFKNATSFSSADYPLNLPVWLKDMMNFPQKIMLSGSTFYTPPYYLLIIVLGVAYELSKPYNKKQ